MVFINTDFWVESKNADIVEAVIKKHNHLSYSKQVYEEYPGLFGEEYVHATGFLIERCTRRDLESLFEDLDDLDARILSII